MEQFLIRYGLIAVFAGSAVEADVIPILSGVVAHLGYFGFFGALAATVSGRFLGDCVWYWLGRGFGKRIEKPAFYCRQLPKAERVFGKMGVWQILVARVLYGLRNATMLFLGLKKLNFAKFAAINFVGCLVWGAFLTSLGYFLSFSANSIIGDVNGVEIGLLIFVVIGAPSILLIKYLNSKKVRVPGRREGTNQMRSSRRSP
jgi:membrane protein DedA with SNARE-associated domain